MGLAKHKTRMLSSPTLYPSKILTPWEKLCILRPALEKLDLGKTVTRPGERSRTLGNLGKVSQLSQLSQVSQGQVTVWGLMVLLCVSAEAGGKQRSDPCSTSNVHHVGGMISLGVRSPEHVGYTILRARNHLLYLCLGATDFPRDCESPQRAYWGRFHGVLRVRTRAWESPI